VALLGELFSQKNKICRLCLQTILQWLQSWGTWYLMREHSKTILQAIVLAFSRTRASKNNDTMGPFTISCVYKPRQRTDLCDQSWTDRISYDTELIILQETFSFWGAAKTLPLTRRHLTKDWPDNRHINRKKGQRWYMVDIRVIYKRMKTLWKFS
jgi:hypothetical protein